MFDEYDLYEVFMENGRKKARIIAFYYLTDANEAGESCIVVECSGLEKFLDEFCKAREDNTISDMYCSPHKEWSERLSDNKYVSELMDNLSKYPILEYDDIDVESIVPGIYINIYEN